MYYDYISNYNDGMNYEVQHIDNPIKSVFSTQVSYSKLPYS